MQVRWNRVFPRLHYYRAYHQCRGQRFPSETAQERDAWRTLCRIVCRGEEMRLAYSTRLVADRHAVCRRMAAEPEGRAIYWRCALSQFRSDRSCKLLARLPRLVERASGFLVLPRAAGIVLVVAYVVGSSS